MGEGLDLVFQYFFTIGVAIGMGLMVSIVPSLVIYKWVSKKLEGRRR